MNSKAIVITIEEGQLVQYNSCKGKFLMQSIMLQYLVTCCDVIRDFHVVLPHVAREDAMKSNLVTVK